MELEMSSHGTELQQPLTTKCGSKTDGRFRSGQPARNFSGLLAPEPVGHRWGFAELTSREFVRKRGHRYVNVRCTGCGVQKLTSYDSLRSGQSRGCQSCSQKCGAPEWLLQRLDAARHRCRVKTNPSYHRYGGRGVEFRFPSTAEAAVWVMNNLGLNRDAELDRIDNNGHYEPGNLRWSTRLQNMANRSGSRVTRFHEFRMKYPEVRYADNTLKALLRMLTDEEILSRWRQPSCKPKGVYGTFSTADPDIVSRQTAG